MSGLKIALLGAGQLGGSFAMALKAAGVESHIRAYDVQPQHAAYLQQQGAVDAVAASAADAVIDADLVVFATPVRSFRTLAEAIRPALGTHTVITDVGSVKRSMSALSDILGDTQLVPAHPITGSEKAGPEAARANLFVGRPCILTPGENASGTARRLVETLWTAAGADVLQLPVEVHDAVYAHVSHLPHYIAFASAALYHELGISIAAGDTTLRTFLRIARSNPRMWTDIALENREAVLMAMATYRTVLEHIAQELRSGAAGHAGDKDQNATLLLPRILAGGLITTVSLYEQQSGMHVRAFGGDSIRDMAAPMATPPEADIEAISHAAHAVAALVEQAIGQLQKLERLIGEENEAALFALITDMAGKADGLLTPRQ